MATNPLQKYYRQPKFYISLPSQGAYNTPGTIVGDVTRIPVYGMTGIDEIIVKTPDSLLTGDSTINVVQSCVPAIKDAWQLSMLDTDLIFAAIKIATNGNKMAVTHTCRNCQFENDYDLDLTTILEHYGNCQYNNKAVSGELIIKLKPLTYRQYTDFSIDNFRLKQQLAVASDTKDETERQHMIDQLWKELARVQHNIFVASIDSVETPEETVTERGFILEWIGNSDKTVLDTVKEQLAAIRKEWAVPTYKVKCGECDTETELTIDLDQSSFFGKA